MSWLLPNIRPCFAWPHAPHACCRKSPEERLILSSRPSGSPWPSRWQPLRRSLGPALDWLLQLSVSSSPAHRCPYLERLLRSFANTVLQAPSSRDHWDTEIADGCLGRLPFRSRSISAACSDGLVPVTMISTKRRCGMQSPHLATLQRQRPSRFKSHDEEEAAFMAEVQERHRCLPQLCHLTCCHDTSPAPDNRPHCWMELLDALDAIADGRANQHSCSDQF